MCVCLVHCTLGLSGSNETSFNEAVQKVCVCVSVCVCVCVCLVGSGRLCSFILFSSLSLTFVKLSSAFHYFLSFFPHFFSTAKVCSLSRSFLLVFFQVLLSPSSLRCVSFSPSFLSSSFPFSFNLPLPQILYNTGFTEAEKNEVGFKFWLSRLECWLRIVECRVDFRRGERERERERERGRERERRERY
jgi:hypothetical protein